jgi:hypothetical protein
MEQANCLHNEWKAAVSETSKAETLHILISVINVVGTCFMTIMWEHDLQRMLRSCELWHDWSRATGSIAIHIIESLNIDLTLVYGLN